MQTQTQRPTQTTNIEDFNRTPRNKSLLSPPSGTGFESATPSKPFQQCFQPPCLTKRTKIKTNVVDLPVVNGQLFSQPSTALIFISSPNKLIKSATGKRTETKTAEETNPYKQDLIAIYEDHRPTEMHEVDYLLDRYSGREALLLDFLRNNYFANRGDPRSQLITVFQKHNLGKIPDSVDEMLATYRGREADIFLDLVVRTGIPIEELHDFDSGDESLEAPMSPRETKVPFLKKTLTDEADKKVDKVDEINTTGGYLVPPSVESPSPPSLGSIPEEQSSLVKGNSTGESVDPANQSNPFRNISLATPESDVVPVLAGFQALRQHSITPLTQPTKPMDPELMKTSKSVLITHQQIKPKVSAGKQESTELSNPFQNLSLIPPSDAHMPISGGFAALRQNRSIQSSFEVSEQTQAKELPGREQPISARLELKTTAPNDTERSNPFQNVSLVVPSTKVGPNSDTFAALKQNVKEDSPSFASVWPATESKTSKNERRQISSRPDASASDPPVNIGQGFPAKLKTSFRNKDNEHRTAQKSSFSHNPFQNITLIVPSTSELRPKPQGFDSLRQKQPPTREEVSDVFMDGEILVMPEHTMDDDESAAFFRHKITAFYRKYNSSKLNTVGKTLEMYKGREDILFRKLNEKYVTGKNGFPPPKGEGATCFLDFRIGDSDSGSIEVKLYSNKVPLAAENFRALCTGEKGLGRGGKPLSFKSCPMHRIVPSFCVQGGDFTLGNGRGGQSIYPPNSEHGDMWGKFKDELFMSHSRKGLLSMANNGPNRNGSQFFVTLRPILHLDGKHVVFGEVTKGMEVIERMALVETDEKQFPIEGVRIEECGEIIDGKRVYSNLVPKRSRDTNAHFSLGQSPTPTPTPFSFDQNCVASSSKVGDGQGKAVALAPSRPSFGQISTPLQKAISVGQNIAPTPGPFDFDQSKGPSQAGDSSEQTTGTVMSSARIARLPPSSNRFEDGFQQNLSHTQDSSKPLATQYSVLPASDSFNRTPSPVGDSETQRSSSVMPQDRSVLKKRLEVFYGRHNPAKLNLIPAIVIAYKDYEDLLFRRLSEKYDIQKAHESPGNNEMKKHLQQTSAADSTQVQCGRETRELSSRDIGGTIGRLEEFYKVYNPPKIGIIGDILKAYNGYEDLLFRRLNQKYKISDTIDTLRQLEPSKVSDNLGTEPHDASHAIGAFQQQKTPEISRSDHKETNTSSIEPDQIIAEAVENIGGPIDEISSSCTEIQPAGASSYPTNSDDSSKPTRHEDAGRKNESGETLSLLSSQYSIASIATDADVENLRDLLVEFYQKHSPAKVAKVDNMLEMYKGNEEELLRMIGGRKLRLEPESPHRSEGDSFTGSCVSPRSYRGRLIELLTKKDPPRLEFLDKMLQEFSGMERIMLKLLHKFYDMEREHRSFEIVDASSGRTDMLVKKRLTAFYKKNTPPSDEALANCKTNGESLATAESKFQSPEPEVALSAKVCNNPGLEEPDPCKVKRSNPDLKYNPHRERLVAIYKVHNPSKLRHVEKLLEKYIGREYLLFEALAFKYNLDKNDQPKTKRVRATAKGVKKETKKEEQARRDYYKKKLIALYEVHNKGKVKDVDRILDNYKNREEELFEKVRQRYNTNDNFQYKVGASGTPGRSVSTSERSGKEDFVHLGIQGDFSISSHTTKSNATTEADLDAAQASQGSANQSHRDHLVSINERHNQEKVVHVEEMLGASRGNERELLKSFAQVSNSDESGNAKADHEIYRVNETQQIANSPTVGRPRSQQARDIVDLSVSEAKTQSDTRTRLTKIYERYNPDKLKDLDGMLEVYLGCEDELLQRVAKKYNLDENDEKKEEDAGDEEGPGSVVVDPRSPNQQTNQLCSTDASFSTGKASLQFPQANPFLETPKEKNKSLGPSFLSQVKISKANPFATKADSSFLNNLTISESNPFIPPTSSTPNAFQVPALRTNTSFLDSMKASSTNPFAEKSSTSFLDSTKVSSNNPFAPGRTKGAQSDGKAPAVAFSLGLTRGVAKFQNPAIPAPPSASDGQTNPFMTNVPFASFGKARRSPTTQKPRQSLVGSSSGSASAKTLNTQFRSTTMEGETRSSLSTCLSGVSTSSSLSKALTKQSTPGKDSADQM